MPKKTRVNKCCKWCGAPAENLITEEKTVRVYDGKKVVKPPKGGKYVAKIVTCKQCDNMVRFYGPKLVLPEKEK